MSKEIPAIFRNFITGEPFDKCLVCEKNLLGGYTEYLVEKAVKENDVIFEYAICMDCAKEKSAELSEDSREAIEGFFKDRMQLMWRIGCMAQENPELDDWISKCMLSGESREGMKEYQLFGHFRGNQLVYEGYPFIISMDVIAELNELLSEETRGWMDDFKDTYFGLPPELEEIFKGRDIVLL